MAAKRVRIDIRMNQLIPGDRLVRDRPPSGTLEVTGLVRTPNSPHLIVQYLDVARSPHEYETWKSTHARVWRVMPPVGTSTAQ